MKLALLELLRSPKSGKKLIHIGESIDAGWLCTEDGDERFSIKNGIPRLAESNYANNFGTQWNYFCKTQLDSYSGHSISADRLFASTGWDLRAMKGKWVLDAGCGAGRFVEVVLNTGANLIALDYSTTVDAAYDNLRHFPNLHLVKGDIYCVPFQQHSFDYVYSLGVLQHTPNVKVAFKSLTIW